MSVTDDIREKWTDLQVLIEKSKSLSVELADKPVLLSQSENGCECRVLVDCKDLSKIREIWARWKIDNPNYYFLGQVLAKTAGVTNSPIHVCYDARGKEEILDVLEHFNNHSEYLDDYAEVVYVASGSTRFYAGERGGEQSHIKLVEEAKSALDKLNEPDFGAIYYVPADLWENISKHLLPIKYISQIGAGFVGTCFAGWRKENSELSINFREFCNEHLTNLLDEVDRIHKLSKELIK